MCKVVFVPFEFWVLHILRCCTCCLVVIFKQVVCHFSEKMEVCEILREHFLLLILNLQSHALILCCRMCNEVVFVC